MHSARVQRWCCRRQKTSTTLRHERNTVRHSDDGSLSGSHHDSHDHGNPKETLYVLDGKQLLADPHTCVSSLRREVTNTARCTGSVVLVEHMAWHCSQQVVYLGLRDEVDGTGFAITSERRPHTFEFFRFAFDLLIEKYFGAAAAARVAAAFAAASAAAAASASSSAAFAAAFAAASAAAAAAAFASVAAAAAARSRSLHIRCSLRSLRSTRSRSLCSPQQPRTG